MYLWHELLLGLQSPVLLLQHFLLLLHDVVRGRTLLPEKLIRRGLQWMNALLLCSLFKLIMTEPFAAPLKPFNNSQGER